MSMEMWVDVVHRFASIKGITNDTAAEILLSVIVEFHNGLKAKEEV